MHALAALPLACLQKSTGCQALDQKKPLRCTQGTLEMIAAAVTFTCCADRSPVQGLSETNLLVSLRSPFCSSFAIILTSRVCL